MLQTIDLQRRFITAATASIYARAARSCSLPATRAAGTRHARVPACGRALLAAGRDSAPRQCRAPRPCFRSNERLSATGAA